MFELKKIAPATYLLPKEGGMHVPGLIIATEKLLEEIHIDKPLEQVRNVAYLPGIVGYSIAMPDIHWGYGFPIGGVAGMDAETGVISPGGVGYDINCGVRLALAPISFSSLTTEKKRELLHEIFRRVPAGVGHGHRGKKEMLTDSDYEEIFKKGARYSVDKGFGFAEDLAHTESSGLIEGADFHAISQLAKLRGAGQLGSVGSGNHFVEIGAVDQIFLPEIAKEWDIQPGQLYFLIHSGSRGFGHQVCSDTLAEFMRKGFDQNLPDKQLVAAPIQSEEGKKYFAAMAAAANFAFNNRQRILHFVRSSIQQVLGIDPQEIKLLYDVCHNIAKFEEHVIDGKLRRLCVHRKGATRAYGPNAEELSPLFRKTGQPVLVPGDMARASHIMVGQGNPLTLASACHGAGRAKSRVQSLKTWQGKDLFGYMEKQGVLVMASSGRTVAEEMPDAYKNVDEVVDAVEEASLARKVARLKPHMVLKG